MALVEAVSQHQLKYHVTSREAARKGKQHHEHGLTLNFGGIEVKT